MTRASGRSKAASVSLGGKSLRIFAQAAFSAVCTGNAVFPIVVGHFGHKKIAPSFRDGSIISALHYSNMF